MERMSAALVGATKPGPGRAGRGVQNGCPHAARKSGNAITRRTIGVQPDEQGWGEYERTSSGARYDTRILVSGPVAARKIEIHWHPRDLAGGKPSK
jgi:hypothetical protein